MNFVVDFTTFDNLASLFCPCYCRGCKHLGGAICPCCKYDNTTKTENFCPNCKKLVVGKCVECGLPFEACFMVDWYQNDIGRLIRDYKYHSLRSLGKNLAEMLDVKLPYFAGEVVVVPLPTIDRHVRERGFDHITLLAKKFAKMRGYTMEKLLGRNGNSVQVGAEKLRRIKQAKNAYLLKAVPKKNVIYLLIDDVWTTGASLTAAAKLLYSHGAERVICAVLAVNNAAD